MHRLDRGVMIGMDAGFHLRKRWLGTTVSLA
jgi:hypothetical protein